jgi:hypothetical protein
MRQLLLAAFCCVSWAVTCYAQTTAVRPSLLGPGLASSLTTYNPGTQVMLPDVPIYLQLFYEAHATNYTVLSTDGGKLLTATAASVTFTLPAPGAIGTASYAFGYDGTHAYTVTTPSGTIYGACGGGTTSASALPVAVSMTPDGTNWQCTSYGAPAGAGDVVKAGNNIYTGTNLVTPGAALTASGNIDLSATGSWCGKSMIYNGAAAGTLTILATAAAGCGVPVTTITANLATIAVTGGTFNSNTPCTANPRTKEKGSTIFVLILSNAGSAPVVNVSGDCG